MTGLPIDAVLPGLLEALRDQTKALLVAPPGAGKTTRVAPALLDEEWCAGQVLLLVPRRLAARAAAEFMSTELGEKPGETIGYATRLDSKVGKTTRVIAMTHGVFLSRIQADPELAGVSAVLFDEVHERSLDNDLALALALDAASALRPDVRLVAMSATLDVERFKRLLNDPPTLVSEGKSFPLEVIYAGRDATARIEPQMASAIRSALGQHEGSLLAFLPGVAEIERTADALGALTADIELHKLHGSIDPAAQRKALAAPPAGKRKLVLATSIAETSITLEDVRIVVDSGLARRPRYDRGAGLTRLVTERASRAAVTQRAGRAARQAPGVAIRLWEEAATASLAAHDPPEILEADLSSLLLTCLLWGEQDPARLPFLDPPPAAALAEAIKRLITLGAIDANGRVTEHGRAIAALPLEPRLAHMLIDSAALGIGAAAADVAALLTERGLGGNDPDLELRWRRWSSDRSRRAEAARKLASGWRRRLQISDTAVSEHDFGRALALAFPDRASRRRDASGESWQSVGGRGFRLDPASPLASATWLAVGEVAGRASGARILSAAAIDEQTVLELFGDRVETRHDGDFDPVTGSVTPTRSRRLGAIRLASGPDPSPDQAAIEQALLDGVREHGLDLLPWDERARQLRSRAAFANGFDATIRSARRRNADRPRRGVAGAAARGQTAARRCRPGGAGRHPRSTARLRAAAPPRPHRPGRVRQSGGQPPRNRLFGAGRPNRRSPRPGTVRTGAASDGRERQGPPHPRHHLARRPADPNDERPARLLGRQLAGSRQGDARTLPQASWPEEPASAPPTLRSKRASSE